MKKRILLSIMVIAISATMIVGATTAYFSDIETSNGNTLTAGTLDLTIYGQDGNALLFNVENMAPGYRETKHFTFRNEGTIDGWLDISKIVVEEFENGLGEPEAEAGDVTPNEGELGDVVYFHLFFDNNKNGVFDAGDDMFLDNSLGNLPGSLNMNKFIAAGSEVEVIGEIISWPSSNLDNLAQSDSVDFDLEFTLSQIQ